MSNQLPPLSELMAYHRNKPHPTDIYQRSSHLRSTFSSSPPSSSSPPATPYTSRHDRSYAYIRSSPEYGVEPGFRAASEDSWGLKHPSDFAERRRASASLPPPSDIDPSEYSEEVDRYSEHTSDSAPGHSSGVFSDATDDEGKAEVEEEDEDDLFGLGSSNYRTTFFRTSAERGQPYIRKPPPPPAPSTTLLLHTRKSAATLSRVPTPTMRNATPAVEHVQLGASSTMHTRDTINDRPAPPTNTISSTMTASASAARPSSSSASSSSQSSTSDFKAHSNSIAIPITALLSSPTTTDDERILDSPHTLPSLTSDRESTADVDVDIELDDDDQRRLGMSSPLPPSSPPPFSSPLSVEIELGDDAGMDVEVDDDRDGEERRNDSMAMDRFSSPLSDIFDERSSSPLSEVPEGFGSDEEEDEDAFQVGAQVPSVGVGEEEDQSERSPPTQPNDDEKKRFESQRSEETETTLGVGVLSDVLNKPDGRDTSTAGVTSTLPSVQRSPSSSILPQASSTMVSTALLPTVSSLASSPSLSTATSKTDAGKTQRESGLDKPRNVIGQTRTRTLDQSGEEDDDDVVMHDADASSCISELSDEDEDERDGVKKEKNDGVKKTKKEDVKKEKKVDVKGKSKGKGVVDVETKKEKRKNGKGEEPVRKRRKVVLESDDEDGDGDGHGEVRSKERKEGEKAKAKKAVGGKVKKRVVTEDEDDVDMDVDDERRRSATAKKRKVSKSTDGETSDSGSKEAGNVKRKPGRKARGLGHFEDAKPAFSASSSSAASSAPSSSPSSSPSSAHLDEDASDASTPPLDADTLALHSTVCGMVIETLAMSRSSSLPVSSIYKLVMREQPALKAQRSDGEWMGVFERVLREGERTRGVFGKVESSFNEDGGVGGRVGGGRGHRGGRSSSSGSGSTRVSSSSKKLEAQWFYVPENDEDQERAGLVKSLMPRAGKRSETKKYKQYYWRPVGEGRWGEEEDD